MLDLNFLLFDNHTRCNSIDHLNCYYKQLYLNYIYHLNQLYQINRILYQAKHSILYLNQYNLFL